MNIAFMCDYRAPKSGNFIASLLTLAKKLRSRGDQVYFMFPQNKNVSYDWLPWLEENNFEVTLFDDDRDRKTVFNELKAYLQQRNIQLIHCHFSFCLNVFALNMYRLPGIKLLIHDHMDYTPEKNLAMQYIKLFLLSILFRLQGVGVIAVMKRKSEDYWLCRKDRVWYVPNGLSPERYVPRSLTREELRDQFNIPQDAPMILFLGWDMYRKGVDIAVKAMSEFRKTHPTAQLALLGFGENPTDEQCSWILEKTGIDPRQTPWLRFFPGCEDMFAVHRASDVFLSASRREAFPYGLLEAISQNIPIAAGEIDGTRWSRAYNKCILYPVESVEACVESLNKALEMRFAPSNQDELMDIYGIEPWCTKVMDIYEIVMK